MNNEMTVVLGTVAMEPKGEFDSTMYYEKLNVVTYNDYTYMAIQPSNNILPTNTDYWQLIGGGTKTISGTTDNRPTTSVDIGQMFFDMTIGKPVWWNGTNWVDSTGTQA